LIHYVGKKSADVIGSDLFDLKKDPHEMVSVFDDPEYAEIRNMMEQKLIDEMATIKLPADKLPGGAAVKSGSPPPEEGETKKSKKKKKLKR
jgi:hypothetical protein